ncbi:T9SS type B sorting domain-containing protein [Nostoc sp. XA013]|nr:T9SS type B sorting domain-containing protein [Nostoc sp. XA013]
MKVKGDIIFVGNNILNRAAANNVSEANIPYNGTSDNNSFNMEYIDIDGDPSTFSSSSADLALGNSCSKVVYAGLYWASTYPYERSTNQNSEWQGTPRFNDWNQVKFKLPGGAYINLTADNNPDPAGDEDAIIFDGYNPSNIAASFKDSPIICYKNVTNLVRGLANPNGTYTLANLRAAKGRRSGASSAGWVMVVIYENPTMPGKFISTFDGYAGVQGNVTADININGFVTLPAPFPVRAKLGVGALEGDVGITNDRLRIKANTVATFTDVSNTLNPANNFFNSTITNNNAQVTNRNPYGTNTLGLDLDMLNLSNPLNGIIPNNETGATLRLLTSGDGYGAFLTSFAVEVIEPEIKLVKTVRDISGNNIGGADVNLGQVLDYVLTFQNIGNDDARNLTIRDILPDNTFFNSIDLSGAPGVTYVYNPTTGQVTFTVPNNLVEIGDPTYTIKIRVQVVNTCSELTNACSNIIQNQAYTTYRGALNSNIISDDPSVAGLDSCGLGIPGPANFLVDIDECAFRRTEILCGASVVLTAGSGYASYQWHNASGTVIGNTQSITVTAPGQYYVVNTPTPPCIGITEYITVTRFGTNQTNPVLPFADEIVTCPNDGEQLPNIFLCGLNDSRFIQTNITNAVSIIWEKLNEASCPAVGIDNCANKNPSCVWTQQGTGTNFNVTLAGQYRVVINYQNGCFNRYYFNVYTNLLDAQHIVQNITCNTTGKITVTNVPSTYEFQLVDQNTGTVLVPYQSNPVFPITQAGSYLVQIRQQGVTNGCVFVITDIGVSNLNFQVNVITKNTSCNGFGSIRLQALNVRPQYYYSIAGPSTLNVGPLTDNDYVFQNLSPGTYTVTVRTDDGCTFTSTTTIQDNSNLNLNATILQNITCIPGKIKLTPSGGEAPYVYAIYSINGILQNPAAGDYTSNDTFEIPFGEHGTYVFIMVDNNNCTALSNPVTIQNLPDVVFTTSFENIKCNGANDGSIRYTVTNANGFSYHFILRDDLGFDVATSTSGVFNGLAPGNYTAYFVQENTTFNCEFPTDFTLTQPEPLTGSVTQTQPNNCITNGATISITTGSVTGGTAPYEYSIDGINFGTATSFSGLTAGTYTVTVRDANGCTFRTNAITISPLSPPTNIQFAATAPTCPALTSNVTLTVTGGTGPFVYEITAPAAAIANNGNNAVFSGLAPGTYTFKVTDANGCSFTRNYTINQVTPIAVNIVGKGNPICFDPATANGFVNYIVSGYTTTYNYIIRNSSGTIIFSGTNVSADNISTGGTLPPETYTITVTDNTTNCTATATQIINGPPSALDATLTISPITCTGTGSVTVTATGGWGSYQYMLVGPDGVIGYQSSPVFNNLTSPGTGVVYIVDSMNCMKTETFTINVATPPVLSVNASSNLCYNTTNSASISVAVTGGLAPFSYTINGGGNQSSGTFANLTPGTYTIEVTDANGCTDTVTQTINQQLTTVSILDKGLDCTSSPDAEIDITINGGQAPYSYQTSVNGGAYGAITPVVGSVINYTTATPGTYQFQITDNIGCVVRTNMATIAPLSNPSILSVTQTQNILCNGDNSGAIAVAIDNTAGVAPIAISVVNTTTGTNFGSQTSGLPAGNYTITITDSNSCTDTETITLTQPDAITYNVSTVDITCNNPGGTSYGEIIVRNLAGGTGPFTYHVSNNFGYSDSYNAAAGEDHSFQILAFGIYQVDVIDANGCSVVRNNIIIASPPDDLVIDVSAVTTDCLNGGTAKITVTSAVSSGNFQFAILEYNTIPYSNNYQPADPGTPETTTFTGLTPGVTYTFVVYDVVTQCYYFKSANLPIDSPSNLTATLDVVSNVSCTGSANGNVSFTFSNYDTGATQVNYEIFNAQSNTSTGITGSSTGLSGGPITVNNFGTLPPGNYYILFTEVGGAFTGCTNASPAFAISQSTNLLQVSAAVTKNDNCNTNAGQITATGQYGTAPYQYQLVAAGGPAPTVATWTGTSANVFNTEGGNYTVYIKDANNCIQSAPITLPTDTTPVITASVTNQCGTSEGSFSIQIDRTVNGVAPYSYSINGGAFQNQAAASFTYDNLSSGNYTIQIKDANGCGNVETLQIFVPLNLTPAATLQPSCANNDGEITVTPFGGSGNYEYELQDGSGNTIVAAQATANFTGLAAGNYIVVIHDTTSNCNEQAAISLEVPTPVTFTTSSDNVSCNGGSDGVIRITLPASNDNPPYTYTVNDGTNPAITQNSPVFTGLAAGTYTVTVMSGKNCSDAQTVTITEPSLLDISASATAFACNTSNVVNTSTITVTVKNDTTGNPSGTAPYFYSIDGTNFQNTNTFNIVDNGSTQNITVTVKDSNNCTQTTTVIINPLPEITAVAAVRGTAITCTNDESVQINVTGGSGDFTFDVLPLGSQASVTPGPGNNSATLLLTQPGSYTFQVKDNVTGCYMLTVPYEILPFDTIEVIASNATPVTCFGDLDGTLTINVTGYTGAYSYNVINTAGITVATGNGNTSINPFTISGLSAGNLHVVVTATDTPFCTEDSNTVTVTSPDSPLQLTANQTANVTCDNNQGEITASATGGWGTYLYELVNNTTSTTIQAYAANSTFTGLAAGNYTVSVRDSGGCIVSQTIVLVQPALISATINASVTQVLCHGDTTAMIEALSVAGGQGSYQFILNRYDATGTTIVLSSGPQTSPQFPGLGAGIYSITITDGWNCDLTTPTLTITEPTPLQGFLSANSNMTCLTQAEIIVSGSGGTPPYQFSTDGISYSNTSVYNVGPGTYQYYVKDANGCQAVLTNQATILPVPALQLNLDLSSASINCSGESTAAITANATGGLGSYMYELLDGASNVLAGPQAGNSFTGLPAGNYYVRVVSLDCRETSSVINITDPAQLTVSYIKQDVLCFGDANGSIEIQTTGGTGIIQYAISPNLNQFVTDNVFDALPPGSYQVIVQDQKGCFELLNIDILEPAPLVATVDTVNQELCLNDADGSIAISITGGTGNYLVSLDNVTFVPVVGNQHTFTNLVGDTLYLIYVRDSNGCNVNPPVEQYMDPAVEVIPAVSVQPNCTNNVPGNIVTVTVNIEVVSDVQYSLDGINYVASNTFTNVPPGTHTAYVQHTNGCTKQVPFTIDNLLPITATPSVTANVLCFGDTTGSIEVTATGGTGTIEYAISPAFVYGTANTFNNLAAGTYTVKVRDNIGCEVELTNITVTEPAAALSATVNGTHEICLGDNNGTITITPAGGTAPYTTSLDSNNPADFTSALTYSNLNGGQTYTVYVKDANGCEITPQTFTINNGVDIQPTATVVANCTGNVPGNTVTINVNPAVASQVQYSLDGVTYTASNVFTNVAPGNHTAYVQHTNSCTKTVAFTINALQPVVANANVTANVLCFGQSTGSIQVTATGGTGTIEYAISPAFVYGTANTFNNLAAGTYTVKVRNNIGCEVELANITVTEPAAALSATVNGTHEICLGDNNGTITITPAGGTAPYTTSLDSNNPADFTSAVTYSNLNGGQTYTIYVKDANGCEITPQTFTINNGVDIQPTATVVANCTGNVPGNTVTIGVNPAIASQVQYSLDGVTYAASNTFTNVAPGSHTAYVQHTNGCTKTVPFTINTLLPITASANVTANVLCFGQSTGSIQVTATGGTGTIEYAISPAFAYGTSNTFNNLAAGTYTVKVRDNIGCEVELANITVTEPAAALSATVNGTHEICLGDNNGTITITPAGGTAPYTTSLDSNNPADFTSALAYSNLNGGQTYTVYVKDGNGCEIAPQTFTINNGVDIQPTATVVPNCTGNVPGNTVTINVNPAVASQVQYSLDGVTYVTSNTFNNIAPGSHTAYVQHTNGCTKTVAFTINTLLPITASANVTANVLCFGQSTGSIQVTATGGTGTIEYAISPAFVYGTANTFNNLAAGTYTVKVRDNIGCEVELANITVTEPAAALSATVNGTHEICLGDNNGTITITPAGGTAPYTTSLDSNNPADFTSALAYSNLNGGQTYTVYVKDANGCEIAPQTFTINRGVDIQPTATVVPNCTNNVPGNTVTINVNPAVASQVQYSLDGVTYAASNVFTNVAPGSHTAYVQHANGCTKTVPFTINTLIPITANANVTANVLCFGQSTGSIQVTATGGTGTIEYAISPAFAYGTSNTFNNLAAGTYTVKVRDNIGCEVELANITVTEPAAALSATVNGTHEICLGDNNGTITITPAGGTAPYTTSLDSNNPADFTSAVTYSNLNGGQTYTIYVKDANGCEITPQTFTINRGVDIRPTATVVPNCTNNVPGNTVTINVNPAVASQVQYSLDGINYVASNTFTNVAPGNHTAYVQHTNGCTKTVPFTINTLIPVTANANVTANVLCFGQSTGSIQVTATGGTGVYQYAISPAYNYSSSNTFINLAAGTYSVKVKDQNGCEITLTNITVTQPTAALTAVVNGTPETCDGLDDGTITIIPSGGTAPYYTSLNSNNPANFTTTLTYTGLIGGRQYTVFVKDANGCQITPAVFRVNDGLNLQPTAVVATNCNGNTPGNTVTVSVNPAVVNDVQYSLDGVNYVSSNVFNNLPVGTHTIYVRHTNGCTKTTTVRINPVTPITASATAVNATCNGLSNGRITVTASGGTGPLQYGISPDFNLTSSNVFQNLAAGNYIVRAVDSKGCYKEVTIAVTEPNALQATVVDVLQEICVDDDNGAIEIAVTGGTAPYSTSLSENGTYVRNEFLYENLNGGQTYTIYVKDSKGCTTSVQVTLDAPVDIDARENIVYNCNGNTVTISVSPGVANNVTYSLDGGTPQTGNIFTDLTNGRHTVEVLHASACTDTVSFFISNAVPVTVTLAETGLNKITATAFGGTGNYTYTFNGYDNGRNNVYVFYQSGTYEVIVTDSNGCEARATINVVFVDITIPNVTTPNEDGDNDTWSPGNTQNYPNITTDIFDRYGRKLATLRQGQSWDGKYNGTEMPSGDYWYIIKLGNPNDNREFVGNFTIYR